MGKFNIVSSLSGNKAPTVRGYTLFLNNRQNAELTAEMFTSGYSDPSNDLPQNIRIETLPSTTGRFLYNGTPITANQEIQISDIQAGLLTFEAPDQDSQFSDSFQFSVSDGQDYSNIVVFTVIVNKLVLESNNPPLVGDNSFDLDYNESKVFGLADFTTETSPAYYDPEGDSPLNIKISLLPNKGKLYFDNQEVTEGQVISIDDVAQLYFLADYNISKEHQSVFGFQIEDTGSGRYSNQGLILLNVNALVATPPEVDDNSSLLTDSEYTFKLIDLTNNFVDADGDSHSEFVIKTLPQIGELQYNNIAVTQNSTIPSNDIVNLKYILPSQYAVYNNILRKFDKSVDDIVNDYQNDGYTIIDNADGELTFENNIDSNDIQIVTSEEITNDNLQFEFLVKDDSVLQLESNIAVFSLIPDGNINIPIVENQPPNIGDITIKVESETTTVITLDMIINQAQPPYNDRENDLIDAIRIDSIKPTNIGRFYFNDIPIIIGQIITREQLIAELFTHIGGDINDFKVDSFSFSIRDEVNNQWVQ